MDALMQPPLVQVERTPDGTVTYIVAGPPDSLPPVLGRDLARAWDAARREARAARFGVARLLRFRTADGEWTDLALRDRDACCWAAAADQAIGMHTGYGVSLCLRLLALIELLGRASWAAGLFTLRAGEAWLHPALLQSAASATLTSDGGFEERELRATLESRTALP